MSTKKEREVDHMSKELRKSIRLLVVISFFIHTLLVLHPLPFVEAVSWSPEEALKSFLNENYPWDEIAVSNVQVIGGLNSVPPEAIGVEKGPLGKAVFSFLYGNDKKNMVRANVRAYERVVMSKRSFRKRHVIEDDDIYISRMDVRKLPKSALTDSGKLIGKSLKRSITANIPIVENMIEVSQVVKRGKHVVLLLTYNGMSIRAEGMTKEKGYVGMPVKAINVSSKSVLTGILIDENTVKVEI